MTRLKFYNGLRVGVRHFDMRIASVENGTFYDAHINDDTGSHPGGATGTPLDDLITGMNWFTNDYPGGVVIWYITYPVDLGYAQIDTGMRPRQTTSTTSSKPSITDVRPTCQMTFPLLSCPSRLSWRLTQAKAAIFCQLTDDVTPVTKPPPRIQHLPCQRLFLPCRRLLSD